MPSTRAPDRVFVSAPAKINLFLHVGEKRADGFHDLESLVAFAGAGDVLTAERDDTLSLAVTGSFGANLSSGEDNLVMKAASLLAARVSEKVGARLTLQKELPVASGIGGGSADAAAALRALPPLWNFTLSPDELFAIAAELGSDVPVCVVSRAVLISGRGELIVPIPALPEFWMLLVNPMAEVSTAEAFKRFDRLHPPLRSNFSALPQGEGAAFEKFPDVHALVAYLCSTRNDLEIPAREIAPVVGDVLDEIGRQPGALLARMSGSGATCFGIFKNEGTARAAAAALGSRRSDWWIVATPHVDQ